MLPIQEHPLYMKQSNIIKRGNRMQCIHSRRFQHSTHSEGQINRQKISKETEALNNTVEQMDLTDIYRTLHPKATEYTFSSSAHGTFSRRDHTLGHKKSLSNYKKIEIVPTSFSDHKGMKLEINYAKKMKNPTNTWRLHNMLLNNQWINEQIKRDIKKYMETNDNNNSTLQNLWDAAKAV